jgi:asparagine synthase (glutamine-hydrolysing)
MCGIAGLIAGHFSATTERFASLAFKCMAHRGPDDQGFLLLGRDGGVRHGRQWTGDLVEPQAALVHRRLSILDLTEAGRQPMASADGRYWITYNGEVYNYVELREELESIGHRFHFHTRTDTEVVLAAFAEWGHQALTRFVGMFALAILDVRERRLFLARDFFGIKPLYYTLCDGGFVFASEIKLLRAYLARPGRVNPQRLYDYLYYGCTDHGGETLFADIRQLPAAHYLSVAIDEPANASPVRYWDVDTQQTADLSFDEAAGRLRDLFLDSVRLHLRSDVPVGTALSGGIDSSSIVMAMRHLAGRDLEIHTFSFVADDPAVSEEPHVDVVARAAGAVAHKVCPGPQELVDDLDDLIRAQDEPFGSTSIYAQYRVFRLAHEAGIKVMLDGQGADETMAGYRFYLAGRLASLIRQGRWIEAVRFLRRASHWPGAGKKWLIQLCGDYLLPPRWQGPARKMIGKDLVPAWMNEGWFLDHGVRPYAMNYSTAVDVLKAHLYRSLTAQNLPSLLRYEDRDSMAFSIESRVPFLTPRLVEFLFSLPEAYTILRDGTSKAVFRQAMRGIVPDVILDRRDKVAFATPERAWLTVLSPWVAKTLASEAARQIPALRLDEAEREWQGYEAGRVPPSMRFWRWMNVIEWTRLHGVSYG